MPYFVLCTSSCSPSGGHSLTPPYSDFKVVAEISWDLLRCLQCSHDPGFSYPQPLIIWSKMPRVGAQRPKGSPAMCHVKTCPRKMGNLLRSFILFPVPPNANPGLSGIVWATSMSSKCCHHKKGWLQPFNPPWNWWLSQHLPSFCIPWCRPWPFNGPFWNSVWLLVWFPSAPTIKWLASTFQPTMKLVMSQHLPSFWVESRVGWT